MDAWVFWVIACRRPRGGGGRVARASSWPRSRSARSRPRSLDARRRRRWSASSRRSSPAPLLLLAIVRPIARRHVNTPPQLRTGTAALVGRDGGRPRAHRQRRRRRPVRLEGEVWTARAYDDGRCHRARETGPCHGDPGRDRARDRDLGTGAAHGSRRHRPRRHRDLRAVPRGADGPDHPAGTRRRRGAPRALPAHADAGARDRRAVRRPRPPAHRPARAGRDVQARRRHHRRTTSASRSTPSCTSRSPTPSPSPTRSPTRCRRSSSSPSRRCATSSAGSRSRRR